MAEYSLKRYHTSHLVFLNIIVALLYFLIGKLSLLLAIPGTNVTPVWPSSGLALAAVLLFGYKMMTGIFIGSILANGTFLFQLAPEDFSSLTIILTSVATGLGAALQAGFGLFLIHTLIPEGLFKNAFSTFKFLAIALISPLINSNVGTLAISLSGLLSMDSYFKVWWTWWLGDASGIFIVTPLFYAWTKKPLLYWTPARIAEAFLLLSTIALITYLRMFVGQLPYIYILCLLWAAVRFNFSGAIFVNLLVVIILTAETIYGSGPFLRKTFTATLIELTLYNMVITGIVLLLNAALHAHEEQPTQWQRSSHTFSRYWMRTKTKMKSWWRWK